MPEFRQNMVSKEWVIIATERAKRPDNFVQEKEGVVIVPKLTTPAGFEIGTRIYINTTLPEQCTKFLRGVKIQ